MTQEPINGLLMTVVFKVLPLRISPCGAQGGELLFGLTEQQSKACLSRSRSKYKTLTEFGLSKKSRDIMKPVSKGAQGQSRTASN